MMPTLRIHLLGDFHLVYGDEPVTGVNAPRMQSLLAYLLLHRDAPQSRQYLAFLFWPDSSEPQAHAHLRKLLHRLRRALPEAGRFLHADAQTVQWQPDAPFTLDVANFERLIADGRLQMANGRLQMADGKWQMVDHQLSAIGYRLSAISHQPSAISYQLSAISHLQSAVDLYRGGLLPGCYDDWIVAERERLHELCIEALDRLIVLLEGRQDYRTAIGYTQRLVRHEPLDEAAYVRLMRLYALTGDRVSALRAYQTCVTVLERELGVEPSLATREAYERIRAEEQGSREAGEQGDRGEIRPAPLHNLPMQLTSFIGREREIAEVNQLLARTRLLTLTGPGGCGKTRLALQVAANLLPEIGSRPPFPPAPRLAFPDGLCWVELAGLADPTLVPQAVASSLGVQEQPGRPLTETLLDYLHSRQLLVVLDNFEHLVSACAQLAESLLRACPGVQILATSREALGIAGETVWPVPPMTTPDFGLDQTPNAQYAIRNTQYDAVRLFVERAASVLPTFRLTHENAALVAQVCQQLDGIPLAIEMAAARVKMLTVKQIATRLAERDSFQLLARGSRSAVPRHQTLRATMDWSYDLLSEQERTLFCWLSAFAGGFTLEAAEAVCSDQSSVISHQSSVTTGHWSLITDHCLLATDILDLLSNLVDKSLVMPLARDEHAEARYRLLETARQYAAEKLRDSGETEAIRQQHANFFLSLVEWAEPGLTSADRDAWLERLESEYDNLRAALAWSLTEAGDGEMGLRLAGALVWFWRFRGSLSEGRRWLEEGLASTASMGCTKVRARALYGAGTLATLQCDWAVARAWLQESVTMWRELRDKRGLAHSLSRLAKLAWGQGDYDVWDSLYAESTRLFREVGDRWGLAMALNGWGCVADPNTGLAAALTRLEESVPLWRALGDRWGLARALNNLGEVMRCQGDYARAAALYEESLALQRELGEKGHIAATSHNLGHVVLRLGDDEHAGELFRESLGVFLDIGNPSGGAACLAGLAGVAGAQGQPERAVWLFSAAKALFEAIGVRLDPIDRAEYDRNLAAARAQLDEGTFARLWAEGRTMTMEQAVAEAEGQGSRGAREQGSKGAGEQESARDNLSSAPPLPLSSALFGSLTRREREVAALIALGKSNAAIAADLVIDVKTVEAHVTRILKKLGYSSRAQIAAWAVARGLAHIPEDPEASMQPS